MSAHTAPGRPSMHGDDTDLNRGICGLNSNATRPPPHPHCRRTSTVVLFFVRVIVLCVFLCVRACERVRVRPCAYVRSFVRVFISVCIGICVVVCGGSEPGVVIQGAVGQAAKSTLLNHVSGAAMPPGPTNRSRPANFGHFGSGCRPDSCFDSRACARARASVRVSE